MYISDYGLNWLAGLMAGQEITISLHTGAPGNSGTSNELSSTGGAAYARLAVAASDWSATGAIADNDANIVVFTPNATDAGAIVSHLGYWHGSSFFGWVPLAAPATLVSGTPFTLLAGTADFAFRVES